MDDDAVALPGSWPRHSLRAAAVAAVTIAILLLGMLMLEHGGPNPVHRILIENSVNTQPSTPATAVTNSPTGGGQGQNCNDNDQHTGEGPLDNDQGNGNGNGGDGCPSGI
jgi:hypothetical protein